MSQLFPINLEVAGILVNVFSVFKIPVGYLHFKSLTKCSLFNWCYFELTIDYLSHANIEAKTCEIQPQAFEFVA